MRVQWNFFFFVRELELGNKLCGRWEAHTMPDLFNLPTTQDKVSVLCKQELRPNNVRSSGYIFERELGGDWIRHFFILGRAIYMNGS